MQQSTGAGMRALLVYSSSSKETGVSKGQNRALWAIERIWALLGDNKGTTRRFRAEKGHNLIVIFKGSFQLPC